jgi:transketolase
MFWWEMVRGTTAEIKSLEPLADKWRAFGWDAKEVDGHSLEEILRAVGEGKRSSRTPNVIICRTVKGKGVSFMENQPKFHGFSLDEDQYRQAMLELS